MSENIPRILILSDCSGWVVDRIASTYRKFIPFDIDIDYYTKLTEDELAKKAQDYDLVHYNNADIRQPNFVKSMVKPTIMSVRSFRYPQVALDLVKYFTQVHVIHPELKFHFTGARFISDAVDDIFQPKEFVVGMAFQNEPWNIDYKGVNLVKQACEELGVTFRPCFGVGIDKMQEFYDSIDLYVCASINEGFGTPVMECLLQNIPVISTDVGMGKYTNIYKIEHSVESIKEGILMYYTYPQVAKFRWDIVCNAVGELYLDTIKKFEDRNDNQKR